MANNNDRISCMAENIVAYIYSEMASTEIPMFEKHLAECSSCAEEFAAISEARLSVFEWKRDEFNALETSVFEIPYETQRRFDVPVSEVGFLAGIFTNLRRLGGAAAACAVILIIAGLGFYYFRPGNEVASQNTEKTVVNESRPEIANNIKPVPVKPDAPTPTVAKFSSNTPKRQVAATPVVAKSRRIPANSELAVSNLKRLDTKVKTANRSHLPTLSNFEDSEDDSLRLADLLADVDTKNNN